MTVLTMTGCSVLDSVVCGNCGITGALNLTGLSALTTIDCSANAALTTITGIATCTSLQSLTFTNDDITGALNLSSNTALTEIYGSYNANLTSVNVTGLVNLDHVEFVSCGLTSIDVTTCTIITYLDVSFCNLTGAAALSVTNCTLLSTLICESNPLLTKVDANGTVLVNLYAANCAINYVEMGASATYVNVDFTNNLMVAGPGLGSVDQCLFDLATLNLTNEGTCNLNGTGNAAPPNGNLNIYYVALTTNVPPWIVNIN